MDEIILSAVTRGCWWVAGASPWKFDEARKWANNVNTTFVQGFGGSFVHRSH